MSQGAKPTLFLPSHLRRGGAPSPGVLVASSGVPVPPVEVERALERADPRWFLKFMPHPKPHWAVCERWRDNDPRRQLVRNGTIPMTAAFDMIANCPYGVTADEALSYLERKLVRVTDARRQAEREQAAIHKANDDRRQSVKDELRSDIEHQASRMTSHEARLLGGGEAAHPMIHGADLTP